MPITKQIISIAGWMCKRQAMRIEVCSWIMRYVFSKKLETVRKQRFLTMLNNQVAMKKQNRIWMHFKLIAILNAADFTIYFAKCMKDTMATFAASGVYVAGTGLISFKNRSVFLVTLTFGILFIAFSESCENNAVSPPKQLHTIPAELLVTKYGRSLVFYAQVKKAGKLFKRMYIDSSAAEAANHTGILSDHTSFLFEAWQDSVQFQSDVFQRQLVNGQWIGGTMTSPNYVFISGNSSDCNGCHAKAALTNNVFTFPLLQKAIDRKKVQFIECDKTSLDPCDLLVYQGK